MPIQRTCEWCGASFLTWPKEVRKGWGRFCNRTCKSRYLREQAFLKKVPQHPDVNDCWLWLGIVRADGYGAFGGRGRNRHTNNGAHVYAWERANGQERPDGMQIRHTCDTPLCVNPAHLTIGTALENMRDKVARGRHRWGYAPRKH